METAAIERIETDRLVLERLRREHEPELIRVMLDPRIVEWLSPSPHDPGRAGVVASLEGRMDHWERYGFGLWLMRDRETGEAVGRGGLQWTFVDGLNDVEVGWTVTPERWRQGLATELARASLDVAFNVLDLESVIAFTRPDNIASRRVMEKTAFAQVGEITYAGIPHVLYRHDGAGVRRG